MLLLPLAEHLSALYCILRREVFIMAKVSGPLFSIEARGKIGNAVVHFPWKGRYCVRRWLIPSNPRDIDQRIVRQKMACIGKPISKILTASELPSDGSAIYEGIKNATPTAQIWNAYFTKTFMDFAKNELNFTTLRYDFTSSTYTANWDAVAAQLGLSDLTGDMYATTIESGLQLFAAAYAAFALNLSTGRLDYSTYPSNWDDADITNFGSDITSNT